MKKAVALVIWKDSEKQEKLLGVKRPEDDEDHPGMWGFPATSVNQGESWEDAVHRAAEEKLGVEVEIVGELSVGDQKREEFDIRLKNYEVRITDGEPSVPQPNSGTQYVDWRWMRPEEFKKTAETGSLCTSLLLDSRDISYDMPSNIERSSIEHHELERQPLLTKDVFQQEEYLKASLPTARPAMVRECIAAQVRGQIEGLGDGRRVNVQGFNTFCSEK